MNKKVNVLMSTYNGEKYVEEQVDSILAQSYDNIHLYIRDDGSSDATYDVLKKYEDNPKVTLIKGDNLGFVGSFFQLLEIGGDADYFSFADQDDVWMPEKVGYAVEMLEEKSDDIPYLYFSNYDYYDGNMKFKEHCITYKLGPSFINSICDNIAVGCCSVINQGARKLLLSNLPESCCLHDWWIYMLCNGLGKAIYDTRYTVKYRRHDTNATPCGMNMVQQQIWRIKKFIKDDYFSRVKKQIIEFERLHGSALDKKDQKVLAMFTRERYNFFIALKKVFYPKRFRQKFVDELLIRGMFLIGKL